MADTQVIGMPINWNTSLQAHIFGKLWPEIEANYTAYKDAEHAGKEQLALTAGIIMGRFELGPRAPDSRCGLSVAGKLVPNL